jgi:hypothetical protein
MPYIIPSVSLFSSSLEPGNNSSKVFGRSKEEVPYNYFDNDNGESGKFASGVAFAAIEAAIQKQQIGGSKFANNDSNHGSKKLKSPRISAASRIACLEVLDNSAYCRTLFEASLLSNTANLLREDKR